MVTNCKIRPQSLQEKEQWIKRWSVNSVAERQREQALGKSVRLGLKDWMDIQGGGTIPSNFSKKCLNYRRNRRSPKFYGGKRPKIRV